MELVEQLFPEIREILQGLGDVLQELRSYPMLVIGSLQAHEIDVSRLTINLRADEKITEGVVEPLFLGAGAAAVGGRSAHSFDF